QPPCIVAKEATVKNSYIAEGCVIRGHVENSVISTGCRVEEGACVIGSVIMPNSVVRSGATVRYAIVGERCEIGRGAAVGGDKDGTPDWGVAVVGSDKTVAEGQNVPPKAIV
ncbi:MAG: glucose-1-phosphate adenylyltransferase, partial [Clostridia bacterium]|nr:glucose-1-phosphate adenylyltransferase [Clostridia bacterium]